MAKQRKINLTRYEVRKSNEDYIEADKKGVNNIGWIVNICKVRLVNIYNFPLVNIYNARLVNFYNVRFVNIYSV